MRAGMCLLVLGATWLVCPILAAGQVEVAPAGTEDVLVAIPRVTLAGPVGAHAGGAVAIGAHEEMVLMGSRGGVLSFSRRGGGRATGTWRPRRSSDRGPVRALALDGAGQVAAATFDARSAAVHILTRRDDRFGGQDRLVARMHGRRDDFGAAVALSGGGVWLAVGAPRSTVAGVRAGAVVVFRRLGSEWSEVGTVTAPSVRTHDAFGAVLALSADGRVLAVAATGAYGGAGAVHVFERIGDAGFAHVQEIRGAVRGDALGRGLALTSDASLLAIGVPGHDALEAPDAGMVIVLERRTATYVRTRVISSRPELLAHGARGLGVAVAVHRDRVVASRVRGPLLVHDLRSQAELAVSPIRAMDGVFGAGLALSSDGRTIFAGGPRDEPAQVRGAGAVQIFGLVPSTWVAPRDEARWAAQRAERVSRREHALADRVLVQLAVGAPLVALATAAEIGLRAEAARPISCAGFFCIDWNRVAASLAVFLFPFGMSAVLFNVVHGIGSAMGGRGRGLHALVGYLVGGALGAGAVGLGWALGHPGGAASRDAEGFVAAGIGLAGLLALSGSVIGYALADQDIQRRYDEPDVTPIVSASADQLVLGASGRF